MNTDFSKFYGYNFYGVPVPLGVNMSVRYSRGDYVFGLKDGKYYIVRRHSEYVYNNQEFVKRAIKNGRYLEFDTNPFDKTAEEWRVYSEEIYEKQRLTQV